MSAHPALPLADRQEAGRLLAGELAFLRGAPDLIVLGLPRGGLPVALEIARALQAPLDVFVVRKLGLPGQPEYAAGAIAGGGVHVLDIPPEGPQQAARWDQVLRREREELARREQTYRGRRPPLALAHRTVVLVDDGAATGATLEAAARAVRQQHPHQLVIAVPVASSEAARRLVPWADRLVAHALPEPFYAVSAWYRDFPQCSDDEVLAALAAAPGATGNPADPGAPRAGQASPH